MGYKDIMLFWVLLVSLISIFNKALGDNFLVDCGSPKNTTVGDRVFMADTYSSRFLTTPTNILASGTCDSEVVLYKTARIFKGYTKYIFPISQFGRYFIRFYFYPFRHRSFDLKVANFSVSVSQFHILTFFTPQPSTVIKEYSLNVTLSQLEITFEPAHNSVAFLNALEIVLVPDTLIPSKLQNRSYETMSRVNMGGLFIDSENDSLWRSWIPDDDFLVDKDFTRVVQKNTKDVHYGRSVGLATKDDAPPIVYSSCRRIESHYDPSENFNVSWSFEIDQGFQYFIRFHFCDILSKALGEMHINVYVNSWVVAQRLDISVLSNRRLATPVYLDFVTPSVVDSMQLSVHIGPSFLNQHDAILNGLEIMKLNNFKKLNAIVVPPSVPHTLQSDFTSKSSFSGVITGEIIGVVILLIFVGLLCLFNSRKNRALVPKSPIPQTTLPSNMATHLTLAAIQQATSNFDGNQIIGQGAFGKVYKGRLDNGTIIAIKRGNPDRTTALTEFVNEIERLSQFRHRHLVPLIGCCAEQNELIIIYKFMENGSLKSHLYGEGKPSLSWTQRLEICVGAARGIHYLHTGIVDNVVIHRDIKSANILLDEYLDAKIADFGIAKIFRDHQPRVHTEVKGTFGYLDPTYLSQGELNEKADVYSFGVVLLEVVCGRPVLDPRLPEDQRSLVMWAGSQKTDVLGEVIDPQLKGTVRPDCLQEYWVTAMNCIGDVAHRPTMGDVLWRLERVLQLETTVVPDVPEPSTSGVVSASEIEDLEHLSTSAVFSEIVRPGSQ